MCVILGLNPNKLFTGGRYQSLIAVILSSPFESAITIMLS